jgi:hypothetical protein
MNDGAVTLVPGKTDRDLADDYRKQLRDVLKPVAEILDSASRDGIIISFQFARDAFGRAIIQDIIINRPL